MPLASGSPPWFHILPGGPGSWTFFFLYSCSFSVSVSLPHPFFPSLLPSLSLLSLYPFGAEQFPSVAGSRLPCHPLFTLSTFQAFSQVDLYINVPLLTAAMGSLPTTYYHEPHHWVALNSILIAFMGSLG